MTGAATPMRVVWRYVGAGLISAIAFSMLMPYAAATLAAGGASALAVGVFALMPFAVLVLTMPFTPALHRRLGVRTAVWIGLACGLLLAVLLLLTNGPMVWSLAAMVGGVYLALLWGISDTLIAENAPRDRVGRIAGLYQTLVGSALFVGPAMPWVFGFAFEQAAFVALALNVLACLPVATVRTIPSAGRRDARVGQRHVIAVIRALFVAAVVGGVFESGLTAIGAFLAIELGYTSSFATTVAAVIAGGSLAAQYPLGLVVDRFGLARVMLLSAIVLMASSVFMPLAPVQPVSLWILAFVWGAAGGGLYTAVLVWVARRFRGEALARAVRLAIVAYTLGSVIGPGLGGLAVEISPRFGLAALLFALSGSLLFVIGRRLSQSP